MLSDTLKFPLAILFTVFEVVVVFIKDTKIYPVNEDNKYSFKHPLNKQQETTVSVLNNF